METCHACPSRLGPGTGPSNVLAETGGGTTEGPSLSRSLRHDGSIPRAGPRHMFNLFQPTPQAAIDGRSQIPPPIFER
jgi:hypothetical protein